VTDWQVKGNERFFIRNPIKIQAVADLQTQTHILTFVYEIRQQFSVASKASSVVPSLFNVLSNLSYSNNV
jgi:hypothetical protein